MPGEIDYDALAKQFGGTDAVGSPAPVDYDALAKQFGGSDPVAPAPTKRQQADSGADAVANFVRQNFAPPAPAAPVAPGLLAQPTPPAARQITGFQGEPPEPQITPRPGEPGMPEALGFGPGYGSLIPHTPPGAPWSDQASTGAMRLLSGVLSPKTAAQTLGLMVAGEAIPAAANLGPVAKYLKDVPALLKALDVTAKAAVPAAAGIMGAKGAIEQGVPHNLEDAIVTGGNALFAGLGLAGAIKAGNAALGQFPTTPEASVKVPGTAESIPAETLGGIATHPPATVEAKAAGLEASGQRLAAQAWKSIKVDAPTEIASDVGKVYLQPADVTAKRPYYAVHDEKGEVIVGGTAKTVRDWLQAHTEGVSGGLKGEATSSTVVGGAEAPIATEISKPEFAAGQEQEAAGSPGEPAVDYEALAKQFGGTDAEAVAPATETAPVAPPVPSPAPESHTGLDVAGGEMGKAVVGNMYDALWAKVQAGDVNEQGAPSAVLQAAKRIRDAGGIETPEEFKAMAQDYAQVPRGPTFQQGMRDLIAKYSPEPADQTPAVEKDKTIDLKVRDAEGNVGTTPVVADVTGDIAVHDRIEGFGYSVTHIPSGLSVTVPTRAQADEIAAKLNESGIDLSGETIPESAHPEIKAIIDSVVPSAAKTGEDEPKVESEPSVAEKEPAKMEPAAVDYEALAKEFGGVDAGEKPEELPATTGAGAKIVARISSPDPDGLEAVIAEHPSSGGYSVAFRDPASGSYTNESRIVKTEEQARAFANKSLGVPVPDDTPGKAAKAQPAPQLKGTEDGKANAAEAEGNVKGRTVPKPRGPGHPVARGAETVVEVEGREQPYKAHYTVRELSDSYPSHNPFTFEPNPAYHFINDRDYQLPENRARVTAGKLKPHKVVNDNPDATNGPSVIESQGNVLGGNNRRMRIERAYAADPENGQGYKAYLILKARNFGIDPAEVAKMKQPVLDRELDDSELDAQRAITDLNKTPTAELSTGEQAAADARGLTPEMGKYIGSVLESAGPDASLSDVLNSKRGPDVVAKLIGAGIFTAAERPALLDAKTGAVTTEAKARIAKMLLGGLFKDSEQFQAAEPSLRNKLERVAPILKAIEANPEWNLIPEVRRAINQIEFEREYGKAYGLKPGESFAIRNRASEHAGEREHQAGMFAETPKPPEGTAKSDALAGFIRASSGTALAKAFRAYAEKSAETSFFSQTTPDDAFAGAFGTEPRPEIQSYKPQLTGGAQVYQPNRSNSDLARYAKLEPVALSPEDGRAATAYVANPDLIELLYRLAQGTNGLGDNVAGAHLAPGDAGILASRFANRVALLWHAPIRTLVDALQYAAGQAKSFIAINDNARFPAEVKATALREELDHAEQSRLKPGPARQHLGSATDAFMAHPLAAQAGRRLMQGAGYPNNPGVLAAEIGVRLMREDGYKELGLTSTEARTLGAHYLKELRKEYGSGKAAEIRRRVATALRRGERGSGQYREVSGSDGPGRGGGTPEGTGPDLPDDYRPAQNRIADDREPVEVLRPPGPEAGQLTGALAPLAKLADAVLKPVVDLGADIRNVFFPQTVNAASETTGLSLREHNARFAASMLEAETAMEKVRDYMAKQPKAFAYDFIDRMEHGRPQADHNLDVLARILKDWLDKYRDDIQALGTGKLESFYENYFPHIWKNPKGAQATIATILGRRPIEGKKGFLKKRKHITFGDGLAAGLEPVSDNPVDLVLLKLHEMGRYLLAHRFRAEMKTLGTARFLSESNRGKVPKDWYEVPDPIGIVYGPRTAEGSTTIRGRYYMPKAAITIVRNHLMPGLGYKSYYQLFRQAGNLMLQFSLGFSGFHAGFVTFEAMISKGALAMKYAAAGMPLEAIRTAVTFPFAPVENLILGRKVIDALVRPAFNADPEIAKYADYLQMAGGRARMDDLYRTKFRLRVADALREAFAEPSFAKKAGALAKAAAMSIPALAELSVYPVMEWLVPNMKVGAFAQMAKFEIARLGTEASREDVRKALANAWDSVDNRFGQLIYENKFWNRIAKDILMISVRSPGWNAGTAGEVLGGAFDYAKFGARVIGKVLEFQSPSPGGNLPGERPTDKSTTGDGSNGGAGGGSKVKDPEFTHKMSYLPAMAAITALTGAIMNYLNTRDDEKTHGLPQSVKDVYWPRTGEYDAQGNPRRIALWGYVNDIFHWYIHPWDTAVGKINPFVTWLREEIGNRTWDHREIANPNDPLTVRLKDRAEHTAGSFKPITVENIQKAVESGDSPASIAGKLLGLREAPGYIDKSPAQLMMSEKAAAKAGDVPTSAERYDRTHARREIAGALRSGNLAKARELARADIKAGTISTADVGTAIKAAVKQPFDAQFKALPLEDQLDVWRVSSEAEKKTEAPLVLLKLMNLKDRSPEELAAMRRRYADVFAEISARLKRAA